MPLKRDNFSLYVHVPFCARKCPYCDFNTYATPSAPESDYSAALCKELSLYASKPEWKNKRIQSVFFGGGTPSLFSPQAIKRVLDKAFSLFRFEKTPEVSLEANPSSMSKEYVQGLSDAGINRISLGAQSFNQKNLSILGRDHSPEQITESVKNCLSSGIENVSVDIIFGIPGQTLAECTDDIYKAIALPIRHFSAYGLTFETGTPFYQSVQRGTMIPLPDEEVIDMMDVIEEIALKNDFQRYEISNYSKDGYQSKHNSAYWNGDSYLGIGAGAHSFLRDDNFLQGTRWSNMSIPEEYMNRLGTKREVVSWMDELDREKLSFEFFFLGLRKIGGISTEEFKLRYGDTLFLKYEDSLRDLKSDGFLEATDRGFALTKKGIHLCDSVLAKIGSIQNGQF